MIRKRASWRRVLGAVFAASFVGALVCRLLGGWSLVVPIAGPALVIAVWAAFGHLITLDDDLSGGWSNPEGDSGIAWSSLATLLVKFLLLAVLVLVVWAR